MNFEQSIAYIEDYMVTHGPFDGLLGFSQVGTWELELFGGKIRKIAERHVSTNVITSVQSEVPDMIRGTPQD